MSKTSVCDLAPRHPVNSHKTNKHLQEDKLGIQRTGLLLSNSAGTFQKENAQAPQSQFWNLTKIAEKLHQNAFEGNFLCRFQPDEIKQNKNGYSNNPASVTHKASDHHLNCVQLPYSAVTTSASDSGCR
jgi:hypothetical protein